MPAEIKMPQQTDTMTEGTVVKWHKKEGDKVKKGEEIADIETDKATMPLEAPDSGTLAAVVAKEGEKLPVGGVVGVIARNNEDAAAVKKQYAGGAPAAAKPAPPKPAPPKAAATAKPAPSSFHESSIDNASSGEMHEPDGAVGHEASRALATVASGDDGNGHSARVKSSPLARRIAIEKGLDLSIIRGTGPGGRIVQKDVLAFLEKGGAAPARTLGAPARPSAPVIPRGERKVTQMTKMRSAIATALQRSKQNVPHYYETIDIDMEAISSLRERLNHKLEQEKIRLSIADFIYKAVASTLRQHPILNSRFNPEKGEITTYGDVNLGIAVAIPDGLIVPVLRGVDQLSLRDIRTRSTDLVERARAQRLRKEESTEATFTITSLGVFGIREFSAIINPPEVAILAIGAAEPRPVVRDGQIVARTMMTVTLSADHRVVDGATAADFLRTLKESLEEPALMFM